MGVRRSWAYLLAAVAAALFLVGLGLALAPPAPDCSDDPSVYCQEAAYGRVMATILGTWSAGIVLLLVGGWILFAARESPARPTQARPPPTRVQEGRRIVSASRPAEEPEMRAR